MEHVRSIEEIIEIAKRTYRPDQAQDINLTVELRAARATGEAVWTILFANSTMTVSEGPSPTFDAGISGQEEDFLAVANGDINPINAYLRGKFQLMGNPGKVLHLRHAFEVPPEFPWLDKLLKMLFR